MTYAEACAEFERERRRFADREAMGLSLLPDGAGGWLVRCWSPGDRPARMGRANLWPPPPGHYGGEERIPNHPRCYNACVSPGWQQ